MDILSGYLLQGVEHESRNTTIYKATRFLDGLPVILKVLSESSPSVERRARFRQEYELMGRLRQDCVARAYALEAEGDVLSIALEDFHGRSLDKIPGIHDLSLAEWLRLAITIAQRVGQLHDCRVIHKDINPSNIVWNRDTDQLKLIDLGLATELPREVAEPRSPDRLEGTLAYIAPEQTGRLNRSVDYRADFYSLGVTFYELLTGRLPFEDLDASEMVYAHIARRPAPARQLRPDIPQVLSAIVDKLMAKNAEDRYQSAAGLIADLRTCLQSLDEQGVVPDFALGSLDFSRSLQIPQKLYGRKEQVEVLRQAFERAQDGGAELVLVTGYSGIGKSALVHELQAPVAAQRGVFIEGKFDQFTRDVPYSALAQAFGHLARRLLMEGEHSVAAWKATLLEALGSNVAVLTEVIPDLALIVGDHPPAVELPPQHAQNRFNHEFRKFVEVFAAREHPLVLFLDDLQWADARSLQIIALLLRQPAVPYLLLVGAYRDNEAGPGSMLRLELAEAERAGAPMQTVTLQPLDATDIKDLLSDTLHADTESLAGLARFCLAKTHGNPFFLSQFLTTLAEREILRPQVADRTWTWDIQRVADARITDNVVDLMVARLRQLPVATQRVLVGAACIGNVFDLSSLAAICAIPLGEAANALWSALEQELVIPLHRHYAGADEAPVHGAALVRRYRFLHDRVHEAATLLAGETERAGLHLAIGRLWLSEWPESEQYERVFDLVNHLNAGRALMSKRAERKALARLNLQAARKAKAAIAYRSGLRYMEIALECLEEDDWEQDYDLMLEVCHEAAEAAYLSVDHARMEAIIEAALPHLTDVYDRALLEKVRFAAAVAARLYRKVVEEGLEVLRGLGMPFPARPGKRHIPLLLLKTRWSLAGKDIDELAQLPVVQDRGLRIVSDILNHVAVSAYYGMPDCFPVISLLSLRWGLKHGYSPGTGAAYASYGIISGSVLGDAARGAEFGRLALRLLTRPEARGKKCLIMVLVHGLISPWSTSLHDVLDRLAEAYGCGVEVGDFEFSEKAASMHCYYAFYAGHNLAVLEQKIAGYRAAIEEMQGRSALFSLRVLQQAVLNLADPAEGAAVLQGRLHSAQELQEVRVMTGDGLLMFTVACTALTVAYLMGRHKEALAYAGQAEACAQAGRGSVLVMQVNFYGSLTRLALYGADPEHDTPALLRKVRRNQKALARWTRHAPANFLHKWHLVEAELARVEERIEEAADHYERAAELAEKHRFLQEEALAHELAADFWLGRARPSQGMLHLVEAHHAYTRWGAAGKVRDLERRFPQLTAHRAKWRARAGASTARDMTISADTTTGALDLMAAMKASQALSQEIVLEKLLRRLMDVVMESAGAQRGLLLLKNEDAWRVEAEKDETRTRATVMQSIEMGAHPQMSSLLQSLVHYVERTREDVVVHNAVGDPLLMNDAYVKQHRPLSLLAIPILHQGQVVGALYLENRSVSGAFTTRHLDVLHMLATQVAISIENARLYASMEARVASRTAELEAMMLRDALTGLANRRAFNQRINEEMARVQRYNQPLALVMLDIDHFKRINDTYGHLVGDECLRRMGETLAAVPHRPSDFVARYGGEEFAILLPATDLEAATVFAERVLVAVRGIVLEVGTVRHPITASAGVAVAHARAGVDVMALIALADHCLYAAKEQGRNRVVAASGKAGVLPASGPENALR